MLDPRVERITATIATTSTIAAASQARRRRT
jgi:hypothetical protein